jgi:membrane protease YdiL (CAAX protease family)
MATRHLLPFFVLTFAITWGIGAAILAFSEPLAARFGEMDLRAPFWKLLYHLMAYGPAISAFVMIAAIRGRSGIRAFARRLLEWRVGIRWYALVLLVYPALRLGARALANAVGSEDAPLFALDPWYAVAPLFLISLIDDPGAVEEIGWRGFALPLLQQRYGALGASVLLGLIWGVWHLPAFFLTAMSQSSFVFPFFLLGTVVLSIVMTAVYNSTRGNVLLMFAFHGMTNFHLGAGGGSGTEMLVALILGLAVALAVIVRLGGLHMGKATFTRVLPAEQVGAQQGDEADA